MQRSSQLAKRQFEARETVDQKQSQLDQARAKIIKTEALIAQKLIRAPFSGQLGTRQIEVGQYLTPGARIVTLTDLSTLYVNFTLPSQMRSQISVGQRVNVTADAFPGRNFSAEITTIEPQISADTRTMTVQATMPNPDNALLPGMFVNAAVVLPPQPDVMVLPETAVDYTLYGDSVYVIREDGKDAKWQSDSQGSAHSGQDRGAGGRQGGDPRGAQTRRAGHRCGSGQGPERRASRDQRVDPAPQPPASHAEREDTEIRHVVSPTSSFGGRCWRWWSAC